VSELRGRLVTLAAVGTGLVVAPFLFNGDYEHGLLVGFCINLLLLTGLNLINGYAGQVSLAQAGFYGLGAYAAGILGAREIGPVWLSFVAAPFVVAAASVIVGLPSLRLRGLYFTMASLGAGVVLFLLFGRAVSLTGGPNGLLGVPVLEFGSLVLDTPTRIYWLAAPLAFLGLAFAGWLAASRWGLAVRAASTSEPAASVAGVPVFRLRLLMFTLSGAYAGLAGALETYENGFVSPEPFGFFAAVSLLVVLSLAGAGTLLGPVVGAALLFALDELLADASDVRPLIIGVLFLVTVQAVPRGVVGSMIDWRHHRSEARARAARPAADPEPDPTPAA
jgi:branched-chain amino acid transport system permease protein